MQPGDWIMLEDIKSEEQMEHICSIVRELLGYRVAGGNQYGCVLSIEKHEYEYDRLFLDRDGDFTFGHDVGNMWVAPEEHNRRWLPSELGAE